MIDTDLLVLLNDEFKKTPLDSLIGLLPQLTVAGGAQMLPVKLPSHSLINLNRNYLVLEFH